MFFCCNQPSDTEESVTLIPIFDSICDGTANAVTLEDEPVKKGEEAVVVPMQDVVHVEALECNLEVTKAPEPELPVQDKVELKTVELVFQTQSGKETVRVEYRPLGLWFGRTVPLKVARVRSEFSGGAAGIQEGWILESVNGEDVQLRIYSDAMAVLERHVKKLHIRPQSHDARLLDLVFMDAAGNDVCFCAHWSPLGLLFEKKIPMVVTSAYSGSYGVLLGIRPGMTLKSVGSEDLTKCRSYDEAISILKKGLEGLPALVEGTKLSLRAC